jgi:hypothetical protein
LLLWALLSRWAVVVPTNRPKKFEQFLTDWEELLRGHNVTFIKVEDREPWYGIPDFIPKGTDMIRSWGFFKAWQTDCDYVLSLDDDVRPLGDPLAAYEQAFERDWPLLPYFSVGAITDTNLEMRGFPYRDRDKEAVVQYGGWTGVPDLDGATQICSPRDAAAFWRVVVPVPRGVASTCCAMNFAFRREYAPLMWQFPLYEGEYNRFGDIWSGLVQKRCLDAIGKVMLINGLASVKHERASDPFVNLTKEAPGLPLNEDMWRYMRLPSARPTNMLEVFKTATNSVMNYLRREGASKGYVKHFGEARDKWVALFS